MRRRLPALVYALALALSPAASIAQHMAHGGPPAPVPPAAREQLVTLAAAVDRYRDFAVAEREGWRKFGDDEPLMGEHWFLSPDKGGVDYVGGDARLDFTRPSNLIYTVVDGRRVLTGVAYTVRIAPGEPVPEGFAGAADRWHVHDFERAIDAALQDRPLLRALARWWINDNYRSKGDNRGRVAMVHAWVTMANPDGVFADSNRLVPYLKLGLPAAVATGAGEDAARGLTFATEGGCAATINGRAWIANLPGRVTRELNGTCAAGAESVRAALASHNGAAINAAGESAYRRFTADWDRLLTPQQKARIAAMGEHGQHRAGQHQVPAMDGSMSMGHGPEGSPHDHH